MPLRGRASLFEKSSAKTFTRCSRDVRAKALQKLSHGVAGMFAQKLGKNFYTVLSCCLCDGSQKQKADPNSRIRKKRKAQRACQGFVGVIRLIRVPAVLPLCVCCGVGAADSVIIIPQSLRFVNIQNRRFFVEIFVKIDTR